MNEEDRFGWVTTDSLLQGNSLWG